MKYKQKDSFLTSALSIENKFLDIDNITKWVENRRESVNVKITPILFSEMDLWYFDKSTGNICHNSGKFFSIEGINVKTNWGKVPSWDQPIINQPEIGFLGIITKEFDGQLYFLMQTKIEPGNINYVQISPTLQATKSNYTKVHKGNTPNYLEYFNGALKCKKTILLDQLQSEQGARFTKKRNRNIIIQIEDDIEVKEDFQWLTLGQIKHLLKRDNLINMDTRTVISGISFGNSTMQTANAYRSIMTNKIGNNPIETELLVSSISQEGHLYELEEIISWITEMKCNYELDVTNVGLNSVNEWVITDTELHHIEHKYFRVFPVRAEIGNREVKSWIQPIVESVQEGIIAFIVKEINGILHFLVQAKLEAGNFDIVELAPTVQCLTGNYKVVNKPPFLDYVLSASGDRIIHDTFQSEEGGRFFREQNRNMIILADKDFEIKVPPNYNWMTLNQLNKFITFNNYLNIQARSLISAIKFI